MSLQNRIIKDYKYFTKAQDKEKCRVYKVIIGEMQRLKEKILSDELVITLLNKMINSENEMPNGGDIIFKEICLTYLPKKATNEEIELWINENIDFSIYKNKMQSIKNIKEAFSGKSDGNQIKNIILEKF